MLSSSICPAAASLTSTGSLLSRKKAQALSGVTYVAALYTALPGIVFRTNAGVNS